MPSQPPDPYLRQFSFTGWSVTHPGEPHQGDKIDLELNEVKQSMDQTQARLALIQRDDGLLRTEAFAPGLQAFAEQVASAAAQATYADNLASLADKELARDNLQMPQHYPELNGDNLVFWTNQTNIPIPPLGTPLPSQISNNPFGGVFPTSTFAARQFRASVLFGTLYDPATRKSGNISPPAVDRVDNVALALLYGGTLGVSLDGSGQEWIPQDTFQGNYGNLELMPGINNPFITLLQLVDVANTREAKHLNAFNHSRIPTANQKAALDASSAASGTNRFATLQDIQAAGSITPNQAAAITGAASPSGSNVFITNTALNGVLTGYATVAHTHEFSDIGDTTFGSLDAFATSIDGRVTAVEDALAGGAGGGGSGGSSLVTTSMLTTALADYSLVGHTHPASEVSVDGVGGLDSWIANVDGTLVTVGNNVATLETAVNSKADKTDSGIAKAWVSFDGSTTPPSIKSNHNVTGVTRNSTGVYTITFASGTFSNANYCWIGSGRNPGSNHGLIISQDDASKTQTTTTLQVTAQGDDGSAQNATLVNVVVYA